MLENFISHNLKLDENRITISLILLCLTNKFSCDWIVWHKGHKEVINLIRHVYYLNSLMVDNSINQSVINFNP